MALERLDASDVTLQLNGEVVDTYTQSDDSTYNINAYGENVDTETLSFSWNCNIRETNGNYIGATFTVPAALDGYYGSVSGGVDAIYNLSERSEPSWSGQFTEGDSFTVAVVGVGADDSIIDYMKTSVEVPTNPQVSLNGATKS